MFSTAISLCVVSTVHAQVKTVTGLISGESLVLYADSEGKSRVKVVPKASLIFPMALVDEDGNYGRVAADGGHYWIELPKVRVRQGVAVACTPGASQKREQVQTAGARGSNDACRW